MQLGQPFVGEGGGGVGSRGGHEDDEGGGWRLLRHSVYRVDSVYCVGASVASMASIGSIASERL